MTITNAKFLVKYTGSPTPTSDTAVAKSLKGAGPLTIGAMHALNELLPDVVEDDGAGDYTITLQALDDLCTAELLTDCRVCSAHVPCSLLCSRSMRYVYSWTPSSAGGAPWLELPCRHANAA
jgi:hypothetical protein